MARSPLQVLWSYRRFFTLYHVGHLLCVLSWLLIRRQYPRASFNNPASFGAEYGLTREVEIGAMAALVLGRYWTVCGTLDEWLDHAFLFGEVAAAVLCYMADPWMLARYAVVVLLVWLLAPYPEAELTSDIRQLSTHELWARVAWEMPELHPRNIAGLQVDKHKEQQQGSKTSSASASDGGEAGPASNSEPQGPTLLGEQAQATLEALREKYAASGEAGASWLVMVTANAWSRRSRQLMHPMAEAAARHGTESMRFAAVDVSSAPELAQALEIDTSPTSPQVPSFLLFEGGMEEARLPRKPKEGAPVKAVQIDARALERVFGLAERSMGGIVGAGGGGGEQEGEGARSLVRGAKRSSSSNKKKKQA